MHKQPIENSYWVESDRFLAGEYPGSTVLELAAAKVKALRDAGVQVFVDLTEVGELLAYSDLVEEPAVHERFPIRDVSVPATKAEMVRILNAVDAHLCDGRLVYVHCWGGVGRTGTVVGCWLARRLGGEAGLGELQRLWRACPKSAHHRSPETPEQRRYVLDWEMGT